MRTLTFRPFAVASLLAITGACTGEGLEIHDLVGKIVVPREAATQVYQDRVPRVDGNGDPVTDVNGNQIYDIEDRTVTDVALIGPIYVGAYPEIDYFARRFPSPKVGPVDLAYPYIGTAVGDFRFACLESLACKVVSGRFVDYDDLVSFFNDEVGYQITDPFMQPVEVGEYIRQQCFELLRVTSDQEVRITVTQDQNDDGVLDAADLQFVENADGDFEAEFKMWQAEFFEGMQLWAYMDAPNGDAFTFDSCNGDEGFDENTYTSDYQAGIPYQDLLNSPHDYINEGDWTTSVPYTWDDPLAAAELVIDFDAYNSDINAIRDDLASDGGGQ